MTPEALCERLILGTDETERNSLLTEADASDACFTYFMETGRRQIGENSEEALHRAQLAVNLAERRSELLEEAQARRLVGQILRVRGDHSAAVNELEIAASRAKEAGDGRLAAQVEIGRIDSLGWMGRNEEAFSLARRLESELRSRGEMEDAAKVLVNIGALHYRRDQYAAALNCYERALETLKLTDDSTAQAKLQANMAGVLMELHRIEEAIVLFDQARASFVDSQMVTAAAMVDANVGFLHYLSGRYVQAITAMQRAREEFSQRGQTLEIAKCDADIADSYRELNLHSEALDAYTRAIDEFETLKIDYERARAEYGRASIRASIGQDETALAGLERASDLFRLHRNTNQLARVRLLRAQIYLKQGNRADSIQEAMRAARALKRAGLHGLAAEARFLLAEMAMESGQNVSRTLHNIRRTANTYSRGWLECRSLRALGQHYLRRGDTARGLRNLRASVQCLEQARTLIAPEEMHVSFLSDKLSIYEDVIGALLTRGHTRDIAEALEYVERAKSRLLLERMLSTVEDRLKTGSLPTIAIDRITQLRAELSRSYHRLNNIDESDTRRYGVSSAEDAVALKCLEDEYRTLLQSVELNAVKTARKASAFHGAIRSKRICEALSDREMLLEYYIVDGSICAWIVTKEKIEYRSGIASMEEVNSVTRKLRYQLSRMVGVTDYSARHAQRFQTDMQTVLGQLYDLLILPIVSLLTKEKIVLVPHGELHGLPFHALFDGTHYTLDKWEFLYSPSAAIWLSGAESSSNNGHSAFPLRKALVIGMPLPGIEMVAKEIQQLAALLPNSNVLCQSEATLEAFRSLAGSCGLLHLATHALYRTDNPLFSGLLLSNGWLLAHDLYEISLDCDLATLSACQTGVTSVRAGDELFGLVRGFLAAGARSVAASLWPADDSATAYLMTTFYRLMLEGSSKSASLRAAQQATREKYPHPYHWAAFTLIGQR